MRSPIQCPDCLRTFQPGEGGPLPVRCERDTRFASALREIEIMAAPLVGAVYEDRRRAGETIAAPVWTRDRAWVVARKLGALAQRIRSRFP